MDTTAHHLAASMLELGAVLLAPEKPFTWASGWLSPIYTDSRRILSAPALRSWVADRLAERIAVLYPEAETIAGVATGAIAHGVLVAERLGKPFVYVRSKPKDHGTGALVEGTLPPGTRVVVVEDMISTGKSSLEAVAALRGAGAEVLGMLALFTYGFDLAAQRFAESGVALETLSSYQAILDAALAAGKLRDADMETLRAWRRDPSAWQ